MKLLHPGSGIGPKKKTYSDRDLSKERLDQITELEEWTKRNTEYNNISELQAVKFLDNGKENLGKDLEHVSKIYSDIVDFAESKFKIRKYTAMEYANVVLLRKTEGHNIEKIREQIQQNS